MDTRLLLPSPPWTSSRSSNDSLTPLSPLTPMMMSLPQSLSPVDWMMTDQLLYGHLPLPSLCRTLSTFPTIPLCRPAMQRYNFPVPLGDPTAPNLTSCNVPLAAPSARNQGDPQTAVSVGRKLRPRSLSMFPLETRPSTIWGQYIRTQGGQLPDPLYPTLFGRTRAHPTWAKKTATKTTTTTKIPSQF